MKNILAFFLLLNSGLILQAQVKKEVSEKDGQKIIITVANTDMYDGTNSKEADRYFKKAADLSEIEDFEGAIQFYKKSIKADPKFVEAYDNLGRVYRRIGNYEQATSYYKKSIAIYPQGMMAHQNLAVIYGLTRNNTGAQHEYRKLIDLDSTNAEGYFGLAKTQLQDQKLPTALKNTRKALAIYRQNQSDYLADAHYLLGLIYYAQNDLINAKKELTKVKELGATISSRLEQVLFRRDENKSDRPPEEIKANDKKNEETVVQYYHWLMDHPVEEYQSTRQLMNGFIMQWLSSTPKLSVELSEKFVPYLDSGDCVLLFMAGWATYAINNDDYENRLQGILSGTESAIQFYQQNKEELGNNKGLEKLARKKRKGKLKKYIQRNM